MKHRNNLALELLLFSLPLILSGILQQLYSWADAYIVGHAEGQLQLAAIGATGSISGLLLHTITGLTTGLSIMAAQEFGRGNHEKLRRISACFFPVLSGLYIVLAIACRLLTDPILSLLDTPAEIFSYSVDYLKIILWGIPFLAVYNLCTALLRAAGNTKAAFFSVLLSSLLNVVLDIVFVVFLHWGVAGAAFATVLSQIAMTLFILLYCRIKYPQLLPKEKKLGSNKTVFREGISFSLPPAIQQSISSLGSLVLQNFMNGFGAATVLAITTAYRVDSIMLLPIFNLGAAVSSMCARAEGARDDERIRLCMKTGCSMMLMVSLAVSLAMFLYGAGFVAFFGVSGEALEAGKQFFRDISVFYPLFGLITVLRSTLEGIGDIRFCSILGIGTLLVRISFSYILRPFAAGRSIAFAEGISWAVMLFILLMRILLRHKKLLNK